MANTYVFIKNLGSGSFGRVDLYKCAPKWHQHPLVAVKSIKETNDEALNEVKILKGLNHPGITKYLTSFDNRGLHIVMEYCDKGSLNENITTLPKGENMVWRFVAHLSNAMNYLHTQHPPIIHRDLKPANILLKTREPGFTYKIADFGISKLTTKASYNRYIATTCCGTYTYMAPEVLDPRLQNYETSVDIWSLGAIISFYCNNGTHLFNASNKNEIIEGVMQWKGGMSTLPRSYSIGLRQLTADMMSPQANMRPSARKVDQEASKDNRQD